MSWNLNRRSNKGIKYAVLIVTISLIILLLFGYLLNNVTTNALSTAVLDVNTTVDLSITVTQRFSSSSESFGYTFKALERDNPMPEGSSNDRYTFTIRGTDSLEIILPKYSEEGTYRYEVYQVIDRQKPNYIYDRQLYNIIVYVDMDLNVNINILNNQGVKVDVIEFENKYTPIPTDKALMNDPPVKKTVYGTSNSTVSFEFVLVAQNATFPMPDGSKDGVKRIKINGQGTAEFGRWSYDRVGTYYYTVYEINTAALGYTYDSMVYRITDRVEDIDGRLVLSRVVTNNLNKQVPVLEFINRYSDGKECPKTGDNTNIAMNNIIFFGSSLFAVASTIYIVVEVTRKGGRKA